VRSPVWRRLLEVPPEVPPPPCLPGSKYWCLVEAIKFFPPLPFVSGQVWIFPASVPGASSRAPPFMVQAVTVFGPLKPPARSSHVPVDGGTAAARLITVSPPPESHGSESSLKSGLFFLHPTLGYHSFPRFPPSCSIGVLDPAFYRCRKKVRPKGKLFPSGLPFSTSRCAASPVDPRVIPRGGFSAERLDL